MPNVHRLGDPNTDNALIISVRQSTVFANGKLISVDLSPVEPHGPLLHSFPFTFNGSKTVFINGIPINRMNDADTCGHLRATGSPNVFVGD